MNAWKSRSAVAVAVLLSLLAASPAIAGDQTVRQGVDLWMTAAGFAQTSFESEPIPAGFFCPESQPFTGRIWFEGKPLATEPAGALGSIDTVVRRLDDVEFDARGVGYTRLQLMALSLVSTRPVDTACGAYDAAVRLDGEQPVTNMRVVRTGRFGGTYAAPLALNVKVVFTPVQGDKSARRELAHRVDLGPAAGSTWAYATAPRYEGTPRLDTDGNGAPDTLLPRASNFLAGVPPVARAATGSGDFKAIAGCGTGLCPHQSCHCDPTSTNPYQSGSGCSHLHCIWTCVMCPVAY
jgi:hypothetical protein